VIGDIEQVLGALEEAGVRYLVVGGVATVLHGRLRTTADLDLVLDLERENALRAVRALSGLGYRPRAPVEIEAFADEEARRGWVRDKGLAVFSLWSERFQTLEVDLFVEPPFDFEEAYSRALRVPLGVTEATVVGLDDLIDLKKKSGRPIDAEDVAALEALRRGDGDD